MYHVIAGERPAQFFVSRVSKERSSDGLGRAIRPGILRECIPRGRQRELSQSSLDFLSARPLRAERVSAMIAAAKLSQRIQMSTGL